jgi:hypothetical protein
VQVVVILRECSPSYDLLEVLRGITLKVNQVENCAAYPYSNLKAKDQLIQAVLAQNKSIHGHQNDPGDSEEEALQFELIRQEACANGGTHDEERWVSEASAIRIAGIHFNLF